MLDTDSAQLSIDTIRTLSIDAVQQAKSGHPGTPMGLAPLVFTLWNRAMRFDPQDPIWPNRDRFALSNGHASMLRWSILHLTRTQAVNASYESLGQPSVTLDDIRHFRQLDSKAPGHPVEGVRSRVVSMMSWDIFEHQPKEHRASVLPPQVTARVAVEQTSTFGWERHTGTSGRIIGMQTFGASAPLKEVERKFGFEPDQVAAAARELLRPKESS